MSYGLQVSVVETGDVDMHERTAANLGRREQFWDVVGVHLATTMHDRLIAQVSPVQLHAPGLRQVLATLVGGGVSEGGFRRQGDDFLELGSNLPHAAQVHFGGDIVPKTGNKALAVPLTEYLKRNQLWPRDLDPGRKVLQLIPAEGKTGVIGVLIDPEGQLGLGTEPLYALLTRVYQEPKPYCYIDQADKEEIASLWQDHVAA